MLKRYMKGKIITEIEDNNRVKFETSEENNLIYNEVILDLTNKDFDNEELEKLLDIEIIIEIKNDWFLNNKEVELINFWKISDFEEFQFLELFKNIKYIFNFLKDENANDLLKKFKNSNSNSNIIENFLNHFELKFNDEEKQLFNFICKNLLNFDLIKELIENSDSKEYRNKFQNFSEDWLIENLIYYMSSEKLYIDILKYRIDIYDYFITFNANFESLELKAIFLMLNFFSTCKENSHIFLKKEEFEKLKNSNLEIINFCQENGLITIKLDNFYYPKIYFEYENKIVQQLKFLKNANVENDEFFEISQSEIENYNDKTIKMNREQKKAINMVLKNKISFITGIAGSGKTTIIKNIINIFNKFEDKKIILSAPSGMAANIMKNKIGKNVKQNISIDTNYKTLNSRGLGKFQINENNKLECNLLIVDEASMIDLRMFYHLIISLSSKIDRIVFIGDKNQLPPIGVGNVFEDIIDSGKFPTTFLIENMRQDGNNDIGKLAELILSKKLIDTNQIDLELKNFKNNQIEFLFDVDHEIIYEKIKDSYLENENWKKITDYEFQVISTLNNEEYGGSLSTTAINRKMNKLIAKKTPYSYIGFSENSRVFISKNIKQNISKLEFDIYNGDLALISEISKYSSNDSLFLFTISLQINNEKIELIYTRRKKLVFSTNTDEETFLNLAFALSVHKIQGSEYNKILYCIAGNNLSRGGNFNSNRMVYTAITRAKEKLIIAGNKELFYQQLLTDYKKGNSNLINLINDNNFFDKKTSLAFISIKTTGLKVENGHEIVNIAIIYDGNKVFNRKFKPKNPITNEWILNAYNLELSELNECDYIDSSIEEIRSLLKNKKIISFIREFDLKFLKTILSPQDINQLDIIDLSSLIKEKFPYFQKYTVDNLKNEFNYENKIRYSANDALFYKFLYIDHILENLDFS